MPKSANPPAPPPPDRWAVEDLRYELAGRITLLGCKLGSCKQLARCTRAGRCRQVAAMYRRLAARRAAERASTDVHPRPNS